MHICITITVPILHIWLDSLMEGRYYGQTTSIHHLKPHTAPIKRYKQLHEPNSQNTTNQLFCWKAHAETQTRDIVRNDLDKAVHIHEEVQGQPSLESEVIKFSDQDSHMVWLEPRLHTKAVEMNQPSYEVEYNHVDPKDLTTGIKFRAAASLKSTGCEDLTTLNTVPQPKNVDLDIWRRIQVKVFLPLC
ncbi:uncharacterized protein MELLADRAFT_89168 [Melampsora larici-populina 98AG31]|uniref:MnmG N-terminal domain-containing protein n=1 Tax=Melampsora larici-populina (strain 98AG31 / pathotype 3-4-7) TaxID=747676 RepID=F4R578_MELLP|nr:uncharacterized protein MELLADRAFT_89168 [Melampsora larici-populina 98AG31]EGG12000.1 hypothetical protein MELLADRAFT_89168 [Melampsora larici-populina 98AG31]